ncbi:MAG: tandem-95 repeat protein, partial [Proteobacteria bacterium]|nr:tandem-95 repeat protein [Pseudomonadota bacterium]
VDDGNGGTDSRDVTITLIGTNDAPVIEGGKSSGAVQLAPGKAAFTVEQWTGYTANGATTALAQLQAFAAANLPNYTATTNIIDYTDDPAGFAGLIPGSSPWPAAVATGATSPHDAINNNFFARITTNILITQADTYTFRTFNDDGVYLSVNGQSIISDSGFHPEQQFTGSIFLTPGVYPIVLFFFEGGGEASLEFSFSNSSGVFQHVAPPEAFDSGTLQFTDVDLSDSHTVSVAPVGTVQGTLTAVVDTDTTGSGTGGVVSWDFQIGNSAYQELGEGDTAVESFLVTVSDGKGGTSEQQVDITITGANDVATLSNAVVDLTETDAILNTAGLLTISDPDQEEEAFNVQSNTAGTYGSFSIAADGNWSYSTNSALDELAEGQIVTDIFSVTSVDGTATNVTVNITGTADGPTAVDDDNMLDASSPAQSTSNTVYWVDWTSSSFVSQAPGRNAVYDVFGTITLADSSVIDVIYHGQANGVQLSGGTDYFVTRDSNQGPGVVITNTEGVGVYTSPQVGNGPTNNDFIQLYHADSSRNLTFSQSGNPVAVDNLFFAIISMNANGYLFDQPFTVVSSADSPTDSGYFGYTGSYTITGSGNGPFGITTPGVYPNEFHGVLAIDNAVQSLTWTSQSHEFWNGFTIGTYGISPTATASGNLLTNDDKGGVTSTIEVTQVNGQAMLGNSLTLTLASGAVIKVDRDGDYLYDDKGKFANLGAGATHQENITYRVTDNLGNFDDGQLQLTVKGVNDAPVAKNDTASTNEDTSVIITTASLLANDEDIDTGDTKTFVSVQNAVNGSVSLNGSNVTFAPTADYNGPASFTYTMKDAVGATSTATVNVTVNAVNDGPSINFLKTSISNGSFEGSTTGWTASQINHLTGWQAADGSYSLDMNAEHGGGYVEQTLLQTVADRQYTVNFALSKNPGSPGGTETLTVTAAGESKDYVFNTLNDIVNMKWSQQSFTFTATGSSTVLRLASADPTGGSDAWGPALDNVRLAADFSAFEDTATTIKGLSIADIDSGASLLKFSLIVDHGSLTIAGSGLSGDLDGSDGTLGLFGSLTDINAALVNGLSYIPHPNYSGADSLLVIINDGGATGAGGAKSDSETISINVVPVNDAPDVSFSGLTIKNASFETTVNSLTDWTVSPGNIDQVPNSGWQSGHGVVSVDLNGSTQGGVKQVLSTVIGATYTIGFMLSKNHDSHGTIPSATVKVSANTTVPTSTNYTFNDATSSLNMKWQWQTFTFTATSTSTELAFVSQELTGAKGPALDGIVPLAARFGTATIINGLSVSDPDSGANPIQLNLSVANGTLSFSGAGLTAIDGNGNDGTLSYSGLASDINAALLNGLAYTPLNPAVALGGVVTLTAIVDDLGATGGGPLTDVQLVEIQVVGLAPDYVF